MSFIDKIITRDNGKAVMNPIAMVRFLEEDKYYMRVVDRKRTHIACGIFRSGFLISSAMWITASVPPKVYLISRSDIDDT